ncbi:NADP-dependent oxidoreductase [Patescibacteria group bacterium]|nr:NADP-dependent oxidoreductase [Patescibacteria group bacterium]
MKAVQINKYGDNSVVEVNEKAAKPEVSAGTVLVEVHAASVNPVDWKIREGYLKEMMQLEFPATLGVDFSGVIAEVGESVSGFKPGDEVYGMASAMTGGSFAEFIIVPFASVALKPKSVSHSEAAAVPLTGLSALQVLKDQMNISNGQKVLIHGGAGGIGTLAIQIAKQLGAEVATTASKEDSDIVKELGADTVIDYKNEKFEDMVKDYDAVFDTIGGETYQRSFQVLKKGGVIVSMVEKPNEELMKQYEVEAKMQFTQPNGAQLAELATLVDEAKMKIKIDRAFPLDAVKEALDYLQNSHHQGKVVITVK